MFRITIKSAPTSVEKLATRGPELILKLVARMNLLMFKLHSKIVGEKIPEYFPNGAPNIAGSVRTIPAKLEGTKIVGEVEAGGPRTTKETRGGPNAGRLVDYAGVQEAGISHSFKIQPVLFSSASVSVRSVTGLPKALAFLLNGKLMIVRSVIHPGLRERPFMRQGLADMEAQIVKEFNEEISGFLV